MDLNMFCVFLLFLFEVSATTRGEGSEDPTFIDGLPESQTVHVRLGQHFKLKCKVKANPPSFTTWYKGEDIIEGSKRIRTFNNYLLVRKSKMTDSGEYHCAARNPFGRVMRTFNVIVSTRTVDTVHRSSQPSDEFTLLKKQMSDLQEKVLQLSSNNIHFHVRGAVTEDETNKVEHVENAKHIYLNMKLTDHHMKHHDAQVHEDIHAHCEMRPNSNYNDVGFIKGNVHLVQKVRGHVSVVMHLNGYEMPRERKHHKLMFHVHQFGDLTNSCDSLGDIYKGKHKENKHHHSNHDSIKIDDNGDFHLRYIDNTLSLHGKYSVLGRSIIIHDDKMERRMACCVIGKAEIDNRAEMNKDKIHESEQLLEVHRHIDPYMPGYKSEDLS